MTNKDRYKRAFSSLHTTEHFEVRLEDKGMAKKQFRIRNAFAAVCAIAALTAGSVTAYAADIGGIQRTIQVWIHGELTDATMTYDASSGSYELKDTDGNFIGGGGGVEFDRFGNERPLTEAELREALENSASTDQINGRLYLLYKGQKLDVTDQFNGDEYCYVTLIDGEEKLYATVTRNGGLATSSKRYLLPHEFRTE